MADVKRIKLPDNSVVNIKDYRIPGVDTVPTSGSGNVITSGGVYKDTRYEAGEVIIGTQTGATSSWTGVSRLATATDFKSGYRFTYWLPYAGSGNATLTLTFQDNTTKTIDLYFSGSSRLTTHIGAGNKIDFLYLENANVAGTTYTGAWIDKGYYSTNTYAQNEYYERRYIYSDETPLYRYKLYGYRDGRVVPLTITNQTSATIVDKTPTSVAIEIDKGVGYYGSSIAVTSASTVIEAQTQYDENAISTATYTFNTNVPAYVDIYLKGNYENGLFTLDTTSNTSWYVYAPNNGTFDAYHAVFEEGCYYMYIGPSYSTDNYFELKQFNPTYCFDGGSLIPIYEKLINYSNFIIGTAINDLDTRIKTKESVLNKVTSISENPTNTNYPSEKAVSDAISNWEGIVRYNTAQTLTDEQKSQARTNIGAVAQEYVDEIEEATASILNDLNDRLVEIENTSSETDDSVSELEEVTSAALNDLNDRVLNLESFKELPPYSSSNNGQVLGVVNGSLAWVTPINVYTGTGTPDASTGNNGDIYVQTSE